MPDGPNPTQTLDGAARRRLELAERQWQLTVDAAPHGMALMDLDGTIRHANPALAALLGRAPHDLATRTFQELTHPADLQIDLDNHSALLRGVVERYTTAKRCRHADGHWIWTAVSVAVVRNPVTGEPAHFVATVEDVTARRAAEEAAVEELNRQNAIIAAQTAIAGIELTPEAVQHEICARAAELTGATGAVVELREGEEMVYRAAVGTARPHLGLRVPVEGSLSGLCVRANRALTCTDSRTDPRVNAEACLRADVRSMVVCPLRHGDEVVGVLKVLSPFPDHFLDEDQGVLELLAAPFGSTLSNAWRLETSFEQAITDPLTGLGNRSHAVHELQRALGRHARNGGCTAVLFLDLDGFKEVNDQRGHDAGDQVLVEVGRRLRDTARASDTTARFGGDEFVVVVEAPDGNLDVDRLAGRLIDAISRPFELADGPAVRLGVSIGVAVTTAPTAPNDLLQSADFAMYEAKRTGGGYRVVRPR